MPTRPSALDVPEATAEQARWITDRIKIAIDGTWQLIQEAYLSRAWSVLGYASWDDYCTREFGTSRLRLPREERQEVVSSLREIGMSTRAIAAATGMNQSTVVRDLPGGDAKASPRSVPARHEEPDQAITAAARDRMLNADDLNDTPDPPAPNPEPQQRVTGTDGKSYAAKPPTTRPPQKQRTDVVATVNRVLLRAQEAAKAADDITAAHLAGRNEEVAVWGRNLSSSLESLHRLQALLNGDRT